MNIRTKAKIIDIVGGVLVVLGVTFCAYLAIEQMDPAPCEKTQSC